MYISSFWLFIICFILSAKFFPRLTALVLGWSTIAFGIVCLLAQAGVFVWACYYAYKHGCSWSDAGWYFGISIGVGIVCTIIYALGLWLAQKIDKTSPEYKAELNEWREEQIRT